MARHPRFVLVDHPQHVMTRGNNRAPIFIADEDYRFYLEKLKQACDKHKCQIHAYGAHFCFPAVPCSELQGLYYDKDLIEMNLGYDEIHDKLSSWISH